MNSKSLKNKLNNVGNKLNKNKYNIMYTIIGIILVSGGVATGIYFFIKNKNTLLIKMRSNRNSDERINDVLRERKRLQYEQRLNMQNSNNDTDKAYNSSDTIPPKRYTN